MLQFMCGKEYTFVLEILVDEKNVKINEEIIKVEINYEDISQNNKKCKKEKKYQYCLTDLQQSKANEEYIRVHVYDVLSEAVKMKEINRKNQGKKILEELENWLIKNYKGNKKNYLNDIKNAKDLFSEDYEKETKKYYYISSAINENSFNRIGSTMKNCNSIQMNRLKRIQMRKNYNTYKNPINMNHAPLNKLSVNTKMNDITLGICHDYIRKKYYKQLVPKDNTLNQKRIKTIENLNRAPLPINNISNKSYNIIKKEKDGPNSNYQNNPFVYKKPIRNINMNNNNKIQNINQSHNMIKRPNSNYQVGSSKYPKKKLDLNLNSSKDDKKVNENNTSKNNK